MNVRNEICDLLDRGEKGYVTIGDVGVATFHIAIMVVATHLLYCSIPMWKGMIMNPMGSTLDFSILEYVGFIVSMLLIVLFLFFMMGVIAYLIDKSSKIKVFACKRK